MVHAVGFGIRYRTPVGPLRVDLAYSINGPQYFGFKGTQEDLINAGGNPAPQSNNARCSASATFNISFRSDKHFEQRGSNPADLRGDGSAMAMRCARGEIIDRIAASVGNRVITASDLDRQIRVAAFRME